MSMQPVIRYPEAPLDEVDKRRKREKRRMHGYTKPQASVITPTVPRFPKLSRTAVLARADRVFTVAGSRRPAAGGGVNLTGGRRYGSPLTIRPPRATVDPIAADPEHALGAQAPRNPLRTPLRGRRFSTSVHRSNVVFRCCPEAALRRSAALLEVVAASPRVASQFPADRRGVATFDSPLFLRSRRRSSRVRWPLANLRFALTEITRSA